MSDATQLSMRDARDAEDKRLLENGEIDLLLSGWVETIRGRCIARMRGTVGEDVAQAVCERLWRELKAGRHRDGRLPFRVIVHSVIGWVCNGWNEPGWRESELFDLDGAAPDETEAVIVDLTLEQFVATLPPGDGEVGALYYLEGARARRDRRAARQEAERGVPGDQQEQGSAQGVARGMIVELETLLDELARRHARGEPLDVEGTLVKAGDRADELAPLIEAFLERAPRRAPSDEALAYVRSLDDPPMLRARVAKALRVDDVVDAIVAACKIQPDARPKVRRYYQQLEGGVLDPSRVAASVWDAITDVLGRSRASLTAPSLGATPSLPHPCTGPTALFEPGEMPTLSASMTEPEPPDDVDALFLGDPGSPQTSR